MATANTNLGLNPNDVIRTSISLSSTPASYQNFGACLLLGSSPTIDVTERRRVYTQMSNVASDFASTSPEFAWAELFFSQSPQPALLYIGRWAQTATPGILHGASLTPAQRLLSTFNAVTNGGMVIPVDGTPRTIGNLNFSAATNLNGVAFLVQTALQAAGATGARVLFGSNNLRFAVISGSTGAASSVGYASAPTAAGVSDVSVLLGLSQTPTSSGANASPPIFGIPAEPLINAVSLFDANFSDWYALSVAAPNVADSDHIAAAGYIEAAGRARIYGISSGNTTLADPTRTDDLASILSQAGCQRSTIAYSTQTAWPCASLFGRFATVNYNGSNTTITLKFKQMPGIPPEYLTETQAATLFAKNVNAFVAYQNGASILQEGVMCAGIFIDSRINADWLANYVQTNAFNFVAGLPTKLPQTDAGMNLLKANMTQSCQQAVVNGYIAPGVWNTAGFGTLQEGDVLPLGYYIYVPLVASQSQTDRAKRKTPPFQIACKEAGAVHSAAIQITVNP